MEMLDTPESKDTLREYGELLDKIEDCFDRIKILRREADEVKALKFREVDGTKIAMYDRTIDVLKAACSQVKGELSKYDTRVKELDAYLEPELSTTAAYSSSSKTRG